MVDLEAARLRVIPGRSSRETDGRRSFRRSRKFQFVALSKSRSLSSPTADDTWLFLQMTRIFSDSRYQVIMDFIGGSSRKKHLT